MLRAWRSGGSAKASYSGHVGSTSGQPFVDAHRDLRRVRGGRELVVQLVHLLPLRVRQVEGRAVEVGLVRDVVERSRDPVDRHDVRLAHVQPTSGIHSGISFRVRWIALKK